MPRCSTPRLRTALGAMAALAAILPATAVNAADATTSSAANWKYRLTNTSSTALTTPLDFSIIPPGSVTPPVQVDASGHPVLDPATGQPVTQNPLIPVTSTGFDVASTFGSYDPKNLTVALGQDNSTGSGAPNTQTLLLLFGSKISQDSSGNPVFQPILDAGGNAVGGLAPGQSIDFRLNLANGTTTPPTLVPSSSVSSLLTVQTLTEPSRPAGGGPGASGGTNNIPEPLSVLVWGGMAGVAAIANRRRRIVRALAEA
ncbi:MAG: hypothetical protein U0800_21155 [Isosphaeraceae bacterium]